MPLAQIIVHTRVSYKLFWAKKAIKQADLVAQGKRLPTTTQNIPAKRISNIRRLVPQVSVDMNSLFDNATIYVSFKLQKF